MCLRYKLAAGSAVALLLAAGTTMALAGRRQRAEPTLPDWLTIAGQRVAGLNRGGALRALEGWADTQRKRRFTLIVALPQAPRRMWTVRRSALGAEPDLNAMVSRAFQVVDSESVMDRLSRWLGRGEAANIEPIWRINKETASILIRSQIAKLVDRPPVDARLTMNNGVLAVAPDQPGLRLDMGGAIEIVTDALTKHDTDEAELPVVSVPARITAEEAATIRHQLASFSTHYSEKGNRKRNLEVACQRINGTIVEPGGVFSYNAVVGPREAEFGFRLAPVIVRGRMEPGMGGGVCQVSSTLYNAALLAGLEVVARTHHAFPVHYVPPGRDATVVYDAIDLKLRNASRGHVGFLADAQGQQVRIRVFGAEPLPYAISIERSNISSWGPRTTTVADRDLPAGKRVVRDNGRSGHRVTVWRIYRQDGKIIRRELVSRDTYRAFPRVVAVGVGTRPYVMPNPYGSTGLNTDNPPASKPLLPGPPTTP